MSGWLAVPSALVRECSEPWHLAALVIVCDCANRARGGEFAVSAAWLAERAGCSRGQAARWLADLVSAGWLASRSAGCRLPTQYSLGPNRREHWPNIERTLAEHSDPVSTDIKVAVANIGRTLAEHCVSTIKEDKEQEHKTSGIINSRAREDGVEPSPAMSGFELLSVARELVEASTDLGVAPMLSSADSQALQTWARRGTVSADDLRLVWEWLTTSNEWEPVRCREGWLSWGQIANKNLERRIASARQWERRGRVDYLPTRRDQKPSMTEKERIEWEEWCADIPEILEKQRRNRR